MPEQKKPKGLGKSKIAVDTDVAVAGSSSLIDRIEQDITDLSPFEQLKELYMHAIQALEDDDDEHSLLLFNGCVHECDALLRENDSAASTSEESSAICPEFHYIYAMSLAHLSSLSPSESASYLSLALKRIATGLKAGTWIEGPLKFNIALSMTYIKRACLCLKSEESDVQLAQLAYEKVFAIEKTQRGFESATLALLSLFNEYIETTASAQQKQSVMNWCLERYEEEKKGNTFGALVGMGKCLLGVGQYFCDLLEDMEEIDDNQVDIHENIDDMEDSFESLEAKRLLEKALDCFNDATALVAPPVSSGTTSPIAESSMVNEDTELMCLIGETLINLGNVMEMSSSCEEGLGEAYYRKAVDIFKKVKKIDNHSVPPQFLDLIEEFEESFDKIGK